MRQKIGDAGAIANSSAAACDRLFDEFMTSRDPVVVNRNGWLLHKLHFNASRRYQDQEKTIDKL